MVPFFVVLCCFCFPPFPINFEVLTTFIVYCANSRKLQPLDDPHTSSIKATITGIQFHLCQHCQDPNTPSLFNHPSIRLLLNGIFKEVPENKDKRLPLTLPLLHSLLQRLRQGVFGAYTDFLLETVFLAAFYGFLRCGEFTCKSLAFNSKHDFTISDITLDNHQFTILLKHSKTKKSKGSHITISRINSIFGEELELGGVSGDVGTGDHRDYPPPNPHNISQRPYAAHPQSWECGQSSTLVLHEHTNWDGRCCRLTHIVRIFIGLILRGNGCLRRCLWHWHQGRFGLCVCSRLRISSVNGVGGS